MLLVAIGKAAIAGAGLALAALGIADLAAAIGAKELLGSIDPGKLFDSVALAGGTIGAVAKIVWSLLSR